MRCNVLFSGGSENLSFESLLDSVSPEHSPVVFEGFVVTREPLLGSDNAAVDVVSHEVFLMFGRVPLNKHRGLGVSGGNNLTRSRGDTCSGEKKLLLKTSNDIFINN